MQASHDKQQTNTEHHLEEAMQKLEMSRDSPLMSREDYEKMSHDDLASLAICQDLSSRLEINSLKAMLEQETMKKDSLASLLDRERNARAYLEEQKNRAAQDANEMQQQLDGLKAELAGMKKRKNSKRLKKQRRKLEQELERPKDVVIEQSDDPAVEASESQSTD